MRTLFSLLCLVILLGVATPAQAQLRANLPTERSAARLYDAGGSSFSLNKLFSPDHFKMSHSYEMSMSSFGGNSSSMGMYTNSLMWQFNQKLAARVDVSFAHSLFGNDTASKLMGGPQKNGQIFLRNAEIAYRPSENLQFNFSFRQSPYGGYMSPFGYNPGYMGFAQQSQNLFWKDGR